MALRSYEKGYTNIKVDCKNELFGDNMEHTLPDKHKEYLKGFKSRFDHFRFRESLYGKTELDHKVDNIKLTNKKPFTINNLVRYESFGFDKH